jgi:exopolysaccharide biosynthesis polyprenyl glycosylphosphotransferase
MSVSERALTVPQQSIFPSGLTPARPAHRRGWLVRRMLLVADLSGLAVAYAVSRVALPSPGEPAMEEVWKAVVFLATLPVWIVGAKLLSLYDRDEERTDHTTADDLSGIFHLVTAGSWVIVIARWLTPLSGLQLERILIFWAAAVVLVSVARSLARAYCRRRPAYVQNTLIVGRGRTGDLIARKIAHHPEYGLNVLGFVDVDSRKRTEELEQIVSRGDVQRVIIAPSPNATAVQTLGFARKLRELGVQIDIVPRLFDIVGPGVSVHSVEGLPLIGLPPARLSRSSRAIKRTLDVVLASAALLAAAPLMAYIAVRIKLGSPGPVLFRQARLGEGRREFMFLKFRTMYDGTRDDEHRRYIESSMDRSTASEGNGLFKLERAGSITPFGAWLRRTSLDELPQLINVLRGEMSLVGPRPCIPYETEGFEPHHFDRFLVPAGLTGLWQVTARAHSTFVEALDMDVAYARSWSLGLDLKLLLLTPVRAWVGATR